MASHLPLRLLSLTDGGLQIIYPQTLGVREFDIITYTWGPTVAPYRCDIPGVDWNVIINPRKLRDIKRLMQVANIQYLWVDCVCLNQEDDKEMAAEVMKMYEYVSLLCAISVEGPRRGLTLPFSTVQKRPQVLYLDGNGCSLGP